MTSRSRKVLFWSMLNGAFLGGIVAGVMMYVAWQHNPQEAFHGENGINWLAWVAIGASWFLPVCAIVTLIVSLVLIGGSSKGHNGDKVNFRGATISKAAANQVGLTLMFGLAGAFVSVVAVDNNRVAAAAIIASFVVAGSIAGDRVFRR